ncbi:MAG: GNAT family N-acetyltransferase [Methanimicrococcus sp.]|nr:GNAT family N-acetyltransferase [Methanimicrococcus sp.]
MENQVTVTIRKAAADDIGGIMGIEHLSFHSDVIESKKVFEDRIAVFSDGFLVAVADTGNERKIAGYISSELWAFSEGSEGSANIPYSNFNLNHSVYETHRDDGEELYISSVAVDPSFRGGQIGKKLFMGLLETIQRKYQPKSAILLVNGDWQNAYTMYQKEGFETVAVIPDFFPALENSGTGSSGTGSSGTYPSGTGIIMRKSLRDGSKSKT